MNEIELLAPAGNLNAFKAAINNGANAVYLGLNDFNARIKADNFYVEDIESLTRYAHLFNVLVYVTINTLLKDREIDRLLSLIKACVLANVDAFIVQDLGVAYLLRKHFPTIVLHASTQMGVHNVYGAIVLEQLGFKRVVLSRETSYQDIIEIRKKTNLEIEFFIQGALCVSFSGNCYLSSFLSQDSGNRGRCRQYCRQLFEVYENDTKLDKGYYLSCKDLCLVNEIEKLISVGVTSFKIEGRMRREGYVGIAVSTYRKILDEKRKANPQEIDNLKVAFSRGDFNFHSYLNSQNDQIINTNIQNHLGIKIGKLLSVKKFKDNLFELEVISSHKLQTGDGLKFMKEGSEIASLGVGNVIDKGHNKYKIFTTQKKLVPNCTIYLTLNKKLEDELLMKKAKLLIDVAISARINEKLKVTLSHRGKTITYESNFVCQKGINYQTSKEDIINQFNKMTDTEFEIHNIEVIHDDVFVVKGAINDLRRQGLELLKKSLTDEEYKVKENKFIKEKAIDLKILGDALIIKDIDEIQLLDKDFKGVIIVSPSIYSPHLINVFKKLKEQFKDALFALNLPPIALSQDLKKIDDIVCKLKDIYLISNNIYGLYYASKRNVVAGVNMNIVNSYAIKMLNEFNIKTMFASLEAEKEFINLHPNLYYYQLGYNTLMHFVHCPFKTVYKNNCQECSYHCGLKYVYNEKRKFNISRYKINKCYFELVNDQCINNFFKVINPPLIDLRNIKNKNAFFKAYGERRSKKIEEKESNGLLIYDIN